MERLIVLAAVLLVTGLFSAWWRARDGRVFPATLTGSDPGSRWVGIPIEAGDVVRRIAPTAELTLVEFTAPDCVPCLRTRTLLDEVAAERDDLDVVSLDVAEAAELVRAHRIMRAPTTLLVTREGHLLGRVSGLPRPEELRALVDSTREPQAV